LFEIQGEVKSADITEGRVVFADVPEELALMVGASALLLLCFWGLLRWSFHRRIENLVRATERLAAGEPFDSNPSFTSSELARLSGAFERMSQRIAESTSALREANERMRVEISERNSVEEALRNSEQRLRSIWENSLEPLRLTDAKGTVLTANPSYCRMMERRLEEVQGFPYTEVYQRDQAEEKLARYVEKFRNRSFERNQTKRVTLLSGRTVDVEASYSFIEIEGDDPLLLAIFRDVTERTAFVEQLNNAKEFSENLVKTATVMIVGVDSQERITLFNEAAEQVSGFSKAEMQGAPWNRLVDGAEETAVRLGAAGHRSTFEARLITKNGEQRLISWQTNAILENGRPTGIICFGTDVTESKQQEEHRRALERKMVDAQKLESLGILAGGIAHDFNNLLAAILGNANLAQLKLPAAQAEIGTYLKNVEKTAMRAADLCRQLLAYSGKARFAMQVLDVNDVVRETLELLEVSITKKAALRVELRHGVASAVADPTQLRQVIMNLVINASEAIGDRSGLIRVRTGLIQADAEYFADAYGAGEIAPGEYVFVEVIDNGSGMSAETQKRIFDPFFTTKFTGRGLGLAAVLGIVRGHNGALKLASTVGKGSVFRFLLPAAPAPVPDANEKRGGGRVDWKGDGTILVVDDDPAVRAVIARMVEAFGFDVLQAVDGRHGVEVFTENRADVRAVVLDMTMPNLDGREAIEQMRRVQDDVKVLLVSGFSENCATNLAKGGPNGFLQKPFNPEELKMKLRSILRG
jgi:two-component system, cell cycle sensor histidine kinase and response regulator CckA